MKQVLSFTLEKETKGTFRYQETDKIMPKVGTLYVKKYTFPHGDAPQHLTVTIETEGG